MKANKIIAGVALVGAIAFTATGCAGGGGAAGAGPGPGRPPR